MALDLAKSYKGRRDVAIILVDKNNYQTFTPALYEVASIYGIDHEHPFHTKLRGAVSILYSEIFRGKNIELIQAEVNHIDLEAKHVVTNNGTTLSFDFLVLALGSAASTFGVLGAEEYAFKFKTIENALMLNDKIEELYTEASKQNRPLPISILIGGGGFNGVELAAELSNCAVHIVHRHKITQQSCTMITLLEAGQTILPTISEKERLLIQKRLKNLGINILVNSRIREVGPNFVKLQDGGLLKGDLIVWSAGVKALDLFKKVNGLKLDERGRIWVDEFLRAKNRLDIFAIGDNIIFSDSTSQKPIPQMAYLAIEQGTMVAENITRTISEHTRKDPDEGKAVKLKSYKPGYNFWIAPVGGKNAVAHLGKWGTYSGFLGYLIRQAADLRYFLSVLPFWKGLKLFCEDVRVFSKND